MITNPEYIKMVLGLPDEFFAGWEWQEGDHAISLRDNKSEAIITEFDVWHDPKIIHVKFVGEIGFTYLFSLDNLRPVPSQEQLQELIIKSQNCKPSDVFNLFQTWYYIYSHQKDNTVFNSFKEAWLHCYMWLDKKEWNGESWVKI
ncbi:MAG: hypothetical protein PHG06_00040 [Parabacteroides sp.]|nr:hypothetical protein [Parabacteroides sp.]